MENFICDFEYSPEIAEEAITLWLRRKQRVLIPLTVSLATFLFVMGYLVKDNKIFALGFLAIAIFLFIKIQNKRQIAAEKKRQESTFKSDKLYFHIEIGDDIAFRQGGQFRHIEFSNLNYILESKNLYLIVLKGDILIPLLKTGFIQGTVDGCINHLSKYL